MSYGLRFLVFIRRIYQTIWYIPFLVVKAENWYDYYLDMLGLKKDDWVFSFRNGIKIKIRRNSDERYIALDSIVLDRNNLSFFDGADYDTIIDVGAHIGDSFLDVAQKFPKAKIIAIEPIPSSVASLKENVALNGLEDRVIVYTAALTSKTKGEIEMFSNRHDSGVSKVIDLTGNTIEVDAIPLSELEKHITDKTLFKIDIEGGEYEIFTKENLKLLKRFSGMMIETHKVDKNRNEKSIEKFLKENDFPKYKKKARWYYLRSL